MIKKTILKIFRKLMFASFPNLKILNQNLSWDYIDRNTHNSKLGEHTYIWQPCHISDSQIGDYTYIALNSWVSQTDIGKFCSIGPNFLCGWGIHPTNGISTSPMFYSTLKQNGITLSTTDKIKERLPIKIGNDVFIGANVTVLDGITIGDGAIIGAGAVVSKDIPPYAIAVGSPINIIKYRFDDKKIDEMMKIRWWEFSEEKLLDVEKMFFEIDQFIDKYR